jgi:FkbM family methyltransferase
MILPTATKIALARWINRVVLVARAAGGAGTEAVVERAGIRWSLDLAEGIDFAIWLLGAFEPATQRAYGGLLPSGGVAIDIGANIGAHTLPLAKAVGPGGRVLAVEPTALAYGKLCRTLALNPALAERVTAVQAMLGAGGEDQVPPGIFASWPLEPSADVHPRHLGVRVSTAGARAVSLDALAVEQGLKRIDLIKLDVDGYEFEVLQGAQATLARFRPAIVFELAPYTLAERGVEPEAPIDLLRGLGYRFAGLDGRPCGGDGLKVPPVPTGSSVNLLAVP